MIVLSVSEGTYFDYNFVIVSFVTKLLISNELLRDWPSIVDKRIDIYICINKFLNNCNLN